MKTRLSFILFALLMTFRGVSHAAIPEGRVNVPRVIIISPIGTPGEVAGVTRRAMRENAAAMLAYAKEWLRNPRVKDYLREHGVLVLQEQRTYETEGTTVVHELLATPKGFRRRTRFFEPKLDVEGGFLSHDVGRPEPLQHWWGGTRLHPWWNWSRPEMDQRVDRQLKGLPGSSAHAWDFPLPSGVRVNEQGRLEWAAEVGERMTAEQLGHLAKLASRLERDPNLREEYLHVQRVAVEQARYEALPPVGKLWEDTFRFDHMITPF